MTYYTRMTHLDYVRFWMTGILVLMTGSGAFAIRPDGQMANSQGAPAPVTSPSVLNTRMAEASKRPDLNISWDAKRGIPASVQGGDLLQEGSSPKGKGVGVAAAPDFRQKAVKVMGALSGLYGIKDANQEFSFHSLASSATGYQHVRLNQTYKGLPVFGGQVAIHFDRTGAARSVNGQYSPIDNLDTTPVLTARQAAEVAIADLKGLGKPAGVLLEEPILVVYARDAEPTLAYQLTLSYDEQNQVGRWPYWIDAKTGGILLRFNNVPAVAPDPIGGSATNITGNLLLEEGGSNVTINGFSDAMGENFLYSFTNSWYVFNSSLNDYVHLPYTDWGSIDRTVISAGYGCETVVKYFRDVQNRSILLTTNVPLRANVHVQKYWEREAYWDPGGLYTLPSVNFRDVQPCVLDVVAHEVAHGVNQYTANLLGYDEPGALNESMSDIFGALVEFYAQPDGRASYPGSIPGYSDWLIGEDTAIQPADGVIRDMRNPQTKGHPSRYEGTYWNSSGYYNQYQNNGVQNKFFYLLCEGGSGTNDGIIYSVNGVGIGTGGQLAYLTLSQYMTLHTDYAAARNAWLLAANELDGGVTTTNELAVIRAWAAVGVGPAEAVLPGGAFVSVGDSLVEPYLPSNKVYFVFNPTPTNLSVNLSWSVFASSNATWLSISNSSLTLAAGQTGAVQLVVDQAAAASLPDGVYRASVYFTNDLALWGGEREVVLRVGNNYSIRPTDYDWVDPVAGAHAVLNLSSNGPTAQALPFSVCYYGTPYSNLYVSAYGLMGFDPSGLSTPTNSLIPNAAVPNNMICPLWSDLDGALAQGKVYYGVTTRASVTNIVVTWLDVPYRDSPAKFSFQVLIPYEPLAPDGIANKIIMQYKDVAEANGTNGSGQAATIGIEDATGSPLSRSYSHLGGRWLANERALLFTLEPAVDTNKPVGSIRMLYQQEATNWFEIKFSETVNSFDFARVSVAESSMPNIGIGSIKGGSSGGGMRYIVTVTNVANLGNILLSVKSNAAPDLAVPANWNQAFGPCLYVMPLQRPDFYDDMELGMGQWVASTQVYAEFTMRAWEWGVPAYVVGPTNVPSGTHCWGTLLTTDYPSNMNAYLTSPSIQVGHNPVLNFDEWHDFAFPFYAADFGYVEAFDGLSWTNVTPGGSFSAASTHWTTRSIALPDAQFGDRQIKVRFRATSDPANSAAGMYVDNVKVSSQRAPGVWIYDYTPTHVAAGLTSTTTGMAFIIYNSSTNVAAAVSGSISSPSSNITVVSGSPLIYGTVPPGNFAMASAQLQFAPGASFDSPYASLFHQTVIGSVAGNADILPIYVSGGGPALTTNLLTARSLGIVKDWLGRTLQGNGAVASCLFQVIYSGSNRSNDAPLASGQVTGDDQLLYSSDVRQPWGRFGEGSTPNSGSFRKDFNHNLASNAMVYVRAWDAASFGASVAYGDSPLFAVTNPATQLIDFGAWTVGKPLQYGRDSNGDTLPDGWSVLHGLDPRLPIQPLGSQIISAKAITDFSFPNRVVVSTNFVFVADTENDRIQVWDRDLSVRLFMMGGAFGTNFSRPRGIAVTRDGSRLAVADTANRRVLVFSVDPVTGVFSNLFQFGSYGTAAGQFNDPIAVAFKPTGEIVVADSQQSGTCNNRIQIFSTTGSFVSTFGSAGSGVGQFNRLLGLGIGADGSFYAADGVNNRIESFDNAASFTWQFGSSGSALGEFNRVWDAQPGLANYVYVTDFYNNRIQVVRTSSPRAVVGVYSNAGPVLGAFNLPQSACPAPDGNVLYVADTHKNRVLRLQVTIDADGDGMDDIWEVQHGLDPTVNDALDDADGDGVLNIGEYRNGSDPQILTPGINVRIMQLGVTPPFLTWLTLSGNTYRVQSTTNLMEPNWVDGGTVSSLADGWLTFSNSFGNTNRLQFMRIQWINVP